MFERKELSYILDKMHSQTQLWKHKGTMHYKFTENHHLCRNEYKNLSHQVVSIAFNSLWISSIFSSFRSLTLLNNGKRAWISSSFPVFPIPEKPFKTMIKYSWIFVKLSHVRGPVSQRPLGFKIIGVCAHTHSFHSAYQEWQILLK